MYQYNINSMEKELITDGRSTNQYWRDKQIEWNKESPSGQWWDDATINWQRYHIQGSYSDRILIKTNNNEPYRPYDDVGETCDVCRKFIYRDYPNSFWRHQMSRACKKLKTPI